ncbi:unnamed protein product [Adineta ricciae]|uniref:Uncharacterized protein n=1 Tax=Adineta ricciae TaxID=249248 RepID=A0A813PE90_ADIRI|nr:unnamed protein product [Adineta ricciae]CAF1191691.1 unnamed protein product [Adineta ricciae]
MKYYCVWLLVYSFCYQCLDILATRVTNNELDGLWSMGKGNPQNTFRIVPCLPTNYSKLPWTYEFNLTSQDTTQFGFAAGINGDMYFFQSQIRGHPADWIICLTPNGNVRWTLFVETVPEMDPIGVSNIVSDRQGVLYYTISWSGDTIYTAKICRVTHAQTSHPTQECVENYDLFMYVNAPLTLQENHNHLITAVSDNDFESIPLVLDKNTLEMIWIDRHVFGAGMEGQYRCDLKTGDILWLGGDDRLLKFDYNGHKIFNNNTQPGLSGIDFVLDSQEEIIVRPWQDGSSLPWKLFVSSSDVSTHEIKTRWTWKAPSSILNNDMITAPTMDENGTVYMASIPLAFAIDKQGKTLWTTSLATASEIKTYNLISFCVSMNRKRRVIYIVSGSPFYQKQKYFYFITALNMDTGKVIKRIDLKLADTKSISPQCPILIGDEMLYFSWLEGEYPQKVPIKVMGIEQV